MAISDHGEILACKGRNVTKVEDEVIAQLYRLVEQLVSWKHGFGNHIPGGPELLPIVQ